MPLTLNTSRGAYTLSQAAPAEDAGDALVLTISLERSDGIEKVALRCRVAKALVSAMDEAALLPRIGEWLARDFDMTRENALKSIRSEGRLMEMVFDQSNRGPF